MKPNNIKRGGVLIPSASIRIRFERAITKLITKMAQEIKREVRSVYAVGMDGTAMDASLVSQARIRLNAVMTKYVPLFGKLADEESARMVNDTLKNATVTARLSLKEISDDFTIKSGDIDERTREIMKASTQQAASLIKLIPQKYLADVQGQVMRSIVGGNGLQDLIPYLNKMYEGNIKHARLVALDQTRKAYTGMTEIKMRNAGITHYEWIHSGGGSHPRPLHVKLNGTIQEYANPPYIGDMYGEEVYGNPGELPNCRCNARPIVKFAK
jgi:SPP1 gp7 family putative phage head morphogenesis protein